MFIDRNPSDVLTRFGRADCQLSSNSQVEFRPSEPRQNSISAAAINMLLLTE